MRGSSSSKIQLEGCLKYMFNHFTLQELSDLNNALLYETANTKDFATHIKDWFRPLKQFIRKLRTPDFSGIQHIVITFKSVTDTSGSFLVSKASTSSTFCSSRRGQDDPYK